MCQLWLLWKPFLHHIIEQFLQSFFPLLLFFLKLNFVSPSGFLPLFEQQFPSISFPCMQCNLLISDSSSPDSFLCSCRFTYKMSVFLLKKNGGYFQLPFEVIKRTSGWKLKKLNLHRFNFGKSSQICYEFEHQIFGSASQHQR